MDKKNTTQQPLLDVQSISLVFGNTVALNNVSFNLFENEFLSIIGPNGAGKTCILNCICGFYRTNRGKIFFKGSPITDLPSHKIIKKGIARTFQAANLFPSMSVLDNILVGRNIHMGKDPLKSMTHWPFAKREEVANREIAEDIIDFLEMQAYRHATVGLLAYGLQKRVDLGRALATEPKVLLVDEPMAGMNLEEKQDMARFFMEIQREKGLPIVIIEHDMEVVLDITSRCLVLDWGNIIAQGAPEEISKNPKVINAYLGEES